MGPATVRNAPPQGDEGLGFFDRLEEVVVTALPGLFPLRPVRTVRGMVYRKHWFVLLREVSLPLGLLVVEALLIVTLVSPIGGPATAAWPWWSRLAFWVVAAVPVFWLLWRYENWRNDYYVIGADRVIDVDKAPLGFHSEVREASIAAIQNVSMTMPNALAATLDFGNVIIETAGRDGVLTFADVHRPRQVLEELTARVEEHRRQRDMAQRDQRQQEMVDWFTTYADLSALTVVSNPPIAQLGETVVIEWRVGAGAQVDSWLQWRLEDDGIPGDDNATIAQAGGAGNYRQTIRAGLGDALIFQPVAAIDGAERRGPEIRIPIAGFDVDVPELASVRQPAVVRWRPGRSLERASLVLGDEPDFSGRVQVEPLEWDGDSLVCQWPIATGGPTFVQLQAVVDGEAISGVVRRIDPI